eukprot:15123021-Alexandrium_andersonii.AAC.1
MVQRQWRDARLRQRSITPKLVKTRLKPPTHARKSARNCLKQSGVYCSIVTEPLWATDTGVSSTSSVRQGELSLGSAMNPAATTPVLGTRHARKHGTVRHKDGTARRHQTSAQAH